ncbi:MAG: reductive dehalogenase [Candidatus Eisenbacteria bacterium]|uniref:Reductive dehalogenase n=1 Tax=Eiseniibacteriota bacterium TaxID=2212470 RepID=A0A948S0B9_UNCEI|nr:reductive dehalogenase [Candidatus Eisenbacteria bacterium]MBU1949188.1 reductive dehalogenase [Candidatus Eisenbacteria bacterium]MBU2691489.1 reductive dehalogenase [Candidatus Eisenbacteria bacterium]
MSLISFIFIASGLAASLFLAAFVAGSIFERAARPIFRSAVLFLVFTVLWFGAGPLFNPPDWCRLLAALSLLSLGIAFFAPIGKTEGIRIGEITERVDERDVVFSREEYFPGSKAYEEYYTDHPEKKDVDDKIRELPALLEVGGRYYDKQESEQLHNIMKVTENLTTKVDGGVAPERFEVDRTETTKYIKRLIRRLGATDVGIAALNPMYLYSHVGRGPEPWGSAIENHHRYVIVFTLEMNAGRVRRAPELPITEESLTQYLRGAHLSISLAAYIRSLGYPARAHISGSNYQIMLPPAAHDAGLGELGRMGYLITPKEGGRVRLGAVTTDLPLDTDQPITFGVQDFCAKCKKCAVNCPPGAIPNKGKADIRGVEKWRMNMESCLRYWRHIGTDCGICMKVCPFSHPPTWAHNIIRFGIRKSSFARTVSVWGDDFIYGKKIV